MKKFKNPLAQPDFQIFLFLFFFALASWPIVAIPAGYGLMTMAGYIYLFWAIEIIIMMLVDGRLAGEEQPGEPEDREGKNRDV